MHSPTFVSRTFLLKVSLRSILGCILFCVMFLWGTIPSSFAAQSDLKQTDIAVDGVSIHISSHVLADTKFEKGVPGLVALAVSYHPYKLVSVTAVPFGSRPIEKNMPVAQSGMVEEYKQALVEAWESNQDKNVQPAPSLTIFGKSVSGTSYTVPMAQYELTKQYERVSEWVAEAGPRLWIVRVAQEIPLGSIYPPDDVLTKLKHTIFVSSTLEVPTKSNQDKEIVSSNDLNKSTSVAATTTNPAWTKSLDWWVNECNSGINLGSYPLGASYLGIPACGPRPGDFGGRPVAFFPGAWGELEWQCAELSMRFLYLVYGINPYPANGKDIVPRYNNSKEYADYNSNNPYTNKLQRIMIPAGNHLGNNPISAGDILSYATGTTAGHTSVVTKITDLNGNGNTLDSGGNGYITVMEQNADASGSFRFPVNNHVITMWGYGTLVGWLHNTQGSTQPSIISSPPAVVTHADGTHSLFAVDSSGRMWFRSENSAKSWYYQWEWFGDDLNFVAPPAVVKHPDGTNSLIALDSAGRMWIRSETSNRTWHPKWEWFDNDQNLKTTPTVVTHADGTHSLFAVDQDGRMLYRSETAPRSWHPKWEWFGDDINLKSSPAVVTHTNGTHTLVAADTNGRMWFRSENSEKSWYYQWEWFGDDINF